MSEQSNLIGRLQSFDAIIHDTLERIDAARALPFEQGMRLRASVLAARHHVIRALAEVSK